MTALREYLAEHPAAEQIGVFDAELETLPARFTIGTAASRIELRHPDPGKTLLLYSAPQSKTGGLTMGKMFELARQGKKNEIKAAMNSPANPDLEARLTRYQALLEEQGTNA